MQLRRADTSLVDDATSAYIAYHDKYVVVYDFAKVGAYISGMNENYHS